MWAAWAVRGEFSVYHLSTHLLIGTLPIHWARNSRRHSASCQPSMEPQVQPAKDLHSCIHRIHRKPIPVFGSQWSL